MHGARGRNWDAPNQYDIDFRIMQEILIYASGFWEEPEFWIANFLFIPMRGMHIWTLISMLITSWCDGWTLLSVVTKSFRDLYLYWFTTAGILVTVSSARALWSPIFHANELHSFWYLWRPSFCSRSHPYVLRQWTRTVIFFQSWDGPKILGQARTFIFLPDFGMDPNLTFFTFSSGTSSVAIVSFEGLSRTGSAAICRKFRQLRERTRYLISSRFWERPEYWRTGTCFAGTSVCGDELCSAETSFDFDCCSAGTSFNLDCNIIFLRPLVDTFCGNEYQLFLRSLPLDYAI